MSRRFVVALIVLVAAFSLTACSVDDAKKSAEQQASQAVAAAQENTRKAAFDQISSAFAMFCRTGFTVYGHTFGQRTIVSTPLSPAASTIIVGNYTVMHKANDTVFNVMPTAGHDPIIASILATTTDSPPYLTTSQTGWTPFTNLMGTTAPVTTDTLTRVYALIVC